MQVKLVLILFSFLRSGCVMCEADSPDLCRVDWLGDATPDDNVGRDISLTHT